MCLAALFVQQQSLSIKEETQNRSLYLCEVLMSKNHICHNFNRGVGPPGDEGVGGLEYFGCVTIKSA